MGRATPKTQELASVDDVSVARPYTPGRLLRWVSSRFFAHIQADESWTREVEAAAERGVVVHILRSISFLDFFCLHVLLQRVGLPLVRFVNDLGLGIFEPFGKGVRRMRLQRQVPEDKALSAVLHAGRSALLFLRRPPRWGKRRRAESEGDLIRTLVETQRRMDAPILLQPHTFVWNQRPATQRQSVVDLFFGPVEWPGAIRRFFQFLFNYRNARLRSGAPFDLQAFMEGNLELTDGELADKVRYALIRITERERRAVVGPAQKTTGRIEEELLRSPRLRAQIQAAAKRENTTRRSVERRARKDLRRLAANQQPWMIRLLSRILGWIFRRIYDGVVVDEAGIERVRGAARDGTLIFLPSHKSHVDYLVLSHVLHQRGLAPPLIAAGENLAFFPLGPLLRRGGAFFIKRSFRGKRLYTALVDAYMRKLISAGFPIEFFLEGGRSRTGKLRAPKLGLLSMVVDAALKAPLQKVYFVPISIGYERIIEEGSYVHELSGGDKRAENVSGLLRTPRILRSKYGRLYVQFGEIMPFAPLRPEFATGEDRRAALSDLGRRVHRAIERVTVVTPAALVASALLGNQRRGLRTGELASRCMRLLEALDAAGAPIAEAIREDGALRQDTLQETVALFRDGGLLREASTDDSSVLRVPEERRVALEYSKNTILHFFVPRALLSLALLGAGGTATRSKLLEDVRTLARLFRYDFMLDEDDQFWARALEQALQQRMLIAEGEHVSIGPGDAGTSASMHARMVRSYVEAYRVAIAGCAQFKDTRDWLKRTLDLGQRRYFAGEVELRESLHRTKLENARRALRNEDFAEDTDALEALDDWLLGLLEAT